MNINNTRTPISRKFKKEDFQFSYWPGLSFSEWLAQLFLLVSTNIVSWCQSLTCARKHRPFLDPFPPSSPQSRVSLPIPLPWACGSVLCLTDSSWNKNESHIHWNKGSYIGRAWAYQSTPIAPKASAQKRKQVPWPILLSLSPLTP